MFNIIYLNSDKGTYYFNATALITILTRYDKILVSIYVDSNENENYYNVITLVIIFTIKR